MVTALDLEAIVRSYLNEASANFYTQANIWQWLSTAAMEISKATLCVRRILTASTGGNGVRNVLTNAYKVIHVEYVPADGSRPKNMAKIDPLRLGHYPLNGTSPQYWYEYGNSIGIEPIPDGVYSLRLYVADVAKLKETLDLSLWTAGAGWVAGDSAIHAGALSDLTYGTAIVAGGSYTFDFLITGTGTGAYLKLTAGTQEGSQVLTEGYHTQSILSNGTTLKVTAYGDITISALSIMKDEAISATSDAYELDHEWDYHLALCATYSGLVKDRKFAQAGYLMSIYGGEFDYLRQNIVEVIPDGRDEMAYK